MANQPRFSDAVQETKRQKTGRELMLEVMDEGELTLRVLGVTLCKLSVW